MFRISHTLNYGGIKPALQTWDLWGSHSLILRVSRILSSLAHPAQHFISTCSCLVSSRVTSFTNSSCAEVLAMTYQLFFFWQRSLWPMYPKVSWSLEDPGERIWSTYTVKQRIVKPIKSDPLWRSLSKFASSNFFCSEARLSPPFFQAKWIDSGTWRCLSVNKIGI